MIIVPAYHLFRVGRDLMEGEVRPLMPYIVPMLGSWSAALGIGVGGIYESARRSGHETNYAPYLLAVSGIVVISLNLCRVREW